MRLFITMLEGIGTLESLSGPGGGVPPAVVDAPVVLGDEDAEGAAGAQAANDGISLDDLHDIEVNQAEVDETLRRGLSPNGAYITNPDENGPMSVFVEEFEEKDDAGTVFGKRLVITLSGRGMAKVKITKPGGGGTELKMVEGRLRVQLSPQQRQARNRDTGEELDKMDSKSNLYANAVKAYANQFGEKPATVKQVVEYLRDYPARFRLIQIGVPSKRNPEPTGEPGNFCVGISAIKDKK